MRYQRMVIPEKPSDPPLRMVQLACGTAAICDVGRGPTIVAIHGFPGSVRDYRWLASGLEPQCRLIRIELPGFGGTPVQSGYGYGVMARARFVVEILEHLELEDVCVVGHSMGGLAAMAVAETSDRVSRLALIASVGRVPHRALRGIPRTLLSRVFSVPILRWMLMSGLRRQMARGGFGRAGDDEMVQTLHYLAALDFDEVQRIISRISCPTLVAWSQDDPFIEPDVSRDLAACCPSGRRLVFPKGGHNLQKSRATEISRAICDWHC